MSLEHPDQAHFESACGYLQLGLLLEANEELEKVDAFNRTAPEILMLRVEIYCGLKQWDLMAEVSARLIIEFEPNDPMWWLCCAYAVRRCRTVEEGKQILIAAESRFPDEALVQYNLACHESVMGDLEAAKRHLKRSLQMKPDLRLQALEDHDLKPLWDRLSLGKLSLY